jgi:hypothetical protein
MEDPVRRTEFSLGTVKIPLKMRENEWCRRRESNDTRLLILRNLLKIYERKNRTTRCMPASSVQNHVQEFECRVSRRPLNAGLRSSLPAQQFRPVAGRKYFGTAQLPSKRLRTRDPAPSHEPAESL